MHIGGDFGGKGGFMDVAVAYFLSKKAGMPVKMVMDYTEELTAGNPRHASIIKVKTGVKKERHHRRASYRFSLRQRRLRVDEAGGLFDRRVDLRRAL